MEVNTTNAGGTIRPEVLVTNEKPYLDIIGEEEKILNLVELIVPLEESKRNRR